MTLLGSTKSKMPKNKNDENVPHLQIIEVVLINWHIVNSNYQQNSRALYTSVPNNSFGQLLDTSSKRYYNFKNFWLWIFIYWSVVYWSKFYTVRYRRQIEHYPIF